MKTLVLGSNGQLGQALADTAPDSAKFVGFDLPELDITSAAPLLNLCREVRPTVIINAAAYTAVDQAESEIELATAVNVEGPRNAAAAARDVGARLVHISTDFVFDGTASTPYGADAETNPLSVYGRTKRAGEKAVLELMPDDSVVVRTAWLYSKTGKNFVKTMLQLMQERDEISVVADQIGTPTWADSLATAVWALAGAPDLSGIFHWTDSGEANWHEFATAIQDEALSLGLLEKVIPIHAITTDDYPTAAARPRYSVLDCSSTCAALGLHQTEWRVNLHQMLKGLAT
jgi:dTDP-4-dehydrorhamnose reductase